MGRIRLAVAGFVFLCTAAPVAAAPAPVDAGGGAAAGFVPGEVLVRFEPGVSASTRAAVRGLVRARLERPLLISRAELLRLRGGDGAALAVAALRRNPHVAWAQLNGIVRPHALPDDPRVGLLWGLHNVGQQLPGSTATGTADADIDAPEGWDAETGSGGVRVAVIDTGVAAAHPDLAPNLWRNPVEAAGAAGVDDDGNGVVDDVRGADFSDRDVDPLDFQGHGTHVAGTIAAQGDNGVGVTGVSWDATLVPVRVIGASGAGTDASVADGLAYAGRIGADVANASLGRPVNGSPSPAMESAVRAHPGTLYVASAGNLANDNDASPAIPCTLDAPNVLCVAATDADDGLAAFSNYGATSVDMAAPGVGIHSTHPHRETVAASDFSTTAGWATSGSGGGWTHDAANGWFEVNPYGDGEERVLEQTAGTSLGGRRGCTALFSAFTNLEANHDFLLVERKIGAGGTWLEVGRLTGVVEDEGGFELFNRFDLRADGRTDVRLRFRLVSDGSVSGGNAFIGSAGAMCEGDYDPDLYRDRNGTSMAAPHVAGAAALLLAGEPTTTIAALRSALLQTGDALPALAGKVASGRRLNLAAALAHLGIVPPPPPPPPPPPADTTAPTVRLAIKVNERRRSVRLQFSGRDAGSRAPLRFTCRLDRKPARRCTSPKVFRRLRPGRHRVVVRAIDAAGNVSAPARKAFRIRRR